MEGRISAGGSDCYKLNRWSGEVAVVQETVLEDGTVSAGGDSGS